jgi:deazaflavin-dependent oxidoreductase (nitroreductase family)
MNGNDFVTFFLRTPLRVFLGNTMLITVTGCKTGRKYSTPVSFYGEGDTLWVISSRDRTWWRNLKNGAAVSLLLKGKVVHAFAEAELSEAEVEMRLMEYVQRQPLSARSLGIRIENKTPNRQDVERVAKERLFVRVKPSFAEEQNEEKIMLE